jgi:hypothetical protein
MENNWLQIVYQYGLGGIFFGVTLYLIFKQGGARLDNPEDRWMLKILIGGYVGYLTVHTLWAYLARF